MSYVAYVMLKWKVRCIFLKKYFDTYVKQHLGQREFKISLVFETRFNVICHNHFVYIRKNMFFKACFIWFFLLKYCPFNKPENQSKRVDGMIRNRTLELVSSFHVANFYSYVGLWGESQTKQESLFFVFQMLFQVKTD